MHCIGFHINSPRKTHARLFCQRTGNTGWSEIHIVLTSRYAIILIEFLVNIAGLAMLYMLVTVRLYIRLLVVTRLECRDFIDPSSFKL